MTQLMTHISPRNRGLLRCLAWSVLVILILASLPFVFHVINSVVDWIFGLLPHFRMPWQEPSL